MTIPLVVLSVFAVGIGLIGSPVFHHAFQNFILSGHAVESAQGANNFVMGLSTLVSVLGIALAYTIYINGNKILPASVRTAFTPIYRLLLNKYYIDEIYEAIFVRPVMKACGYLFKFDFSRDGNGERDGIVNGVAGVFQWLSSVLRRLQTGVVQNYLLFQVTGIILLLTLLGKLCFKF